MQKLINKILVPVDFSPKSKSAVAKAVELARQYQCTVHLLHIVKFFPVPGLNLFNRQLFISVPGLDARQELESRLRTAYEPFRKKEGPLIKLEIEIVTGGFNEAVIDFVKESGIDLVVIGQPSGFIRKRKDQFNPDKISEKTNIPIITVPANKRITQLYYILIPVTNFLPVRKLMYGIYLSSGSLSTIKLLGISSAETKGMVMHYLVKASQLIREHCVVKVEMENVVSENIADTIDQYARSSAADLVILNPGIQTGIHGFFSRLLNRIGRKHTTLPVLTINPI